MSTIDANNPLTWKAPSNNANSCYVNSALWGLLYDDSFINIINIVNTDVLTKDGDKRKCEPVEIKKLKTALANYKDGILDGSIDINDAVTNIREIFQNCAEDQGTEWKSQVGDSSNFLSVLDGLLINTESEIKNILAKYPTKQNNYVVSTTTTIITFDKSSVLKDQNVYNNLFSTDHPTPVINYKILPIINSTVDETTGAISNIINTQDNTQNSTKEIITVTDTETFPRTIEEDTTKYNGSNDGTKVEKNKNYIIINSSKTTTFTYNLNNNNTGIIINYQQKQSGNQVYGDANLGQIWKILDNTIQDKYYQIGKYKLSAFSCWTSSNHYTCYFMFNGKWYLMNDAPSSIKLIESNDENFQRKLFRNSFVFFYTLDILSTNTTNVLCSTEFNYNIKDEQAKLTSSSTKGSSAKKNTVSDVTQLAKKSVKKDWLKMFNDCNSEKSEAKGGTRKKCKRKKNNKCRRTRKGRKTRKIRGKNKKPNKK